MSERKLVIDHLKFSYEGLFNAAEVYNIISYFFYEKSYDWYEQLNEEQVTEKGKQLHIILKPYKNTTSFHKIAVTIKIVMTDLKDVEVEMDKKKIKVNQGLIRMIFDAYIVSDRKNQWTKPWQWFFILIMERYFFKSHLEKIETWVKSDVDDLLYKLKSYLNTYKYTYHQ